jgi:protein involved in polysaccharide export with SLBB domain
MRPGPFPIVLGQTRLSDLVRWGGGFTARANASAVIITRMPTDSTREANAEFERLARMSRQEMTESEYTKFQTQLSEEKNVFRVDMTPRENDKDKSKLPPPTDPLLQAGDIVRVNPLVLSVRVEGEVQHPGLVDYVDGGSLGTYLDAAGGLTQRAAGGAIRVSRSQTGQVIPATSVRDIQPGDFIWVPERRDIDAWTIFRDVITIAAQLAVIVVAFRR